MVGTSKPHSQVSHHPIRVVVRAIQRRQEPIAAIAIDRHHHHVNQSVIEIGE
jgi:hypothetical protein